MKQKEWDTRYVQLKAHVAEVEAAVEKLVHEFADPPPEPVLVPADLIDALAEALAASAGMRDPAIRLDTISYAARALVDAARNGTDQ